MFQLTYIYEARKDKIVDMVFNGSSVRDTARVLKIGINTVIRALKKLTSRQVISEKVLLDDMALICELDE